MEGANGKANTNNEGNEVGGGGTKPPPAVEGEDLE